MGVQTTRLLAAVMFTDIVGYTAMMQEDEDKANRKKERHRQVLNERATAFDGQVLHYYGDGALTIFNSAYNAVMCAIKIQNDLADPYLPLRIGLHMGDIAYNDEDAYGDAVNIASRLEPLAISGGILISQKVNNEVRNHRDIRTKELGTFELKNVKYPISIFAVTNEGINVPTAREIKAKSGRITNRLAVLPFVNMSDEKGFEYFSDGLTEEVINGLTKMERLDVTSRTSAFAYKGRNVDIRTIGEELMVSHILEGSVRKNKDKIRVTAQLIETGGGFHLWSETYEHHLKDIFEIQDGISQEILKKVQKGFAGEDLRPEPKKNTRSIRKGDYERYLEGTFELQKYSIASVRKAMKNFNMAVEKNTRNENSRTALAKSFLFFGILGQMAPQRAYKKAAENINEVLKHSPNNPLALGIKALIEVLLNHNYEAAQKQFDRAFDINPDSSELCYCYFLLLNMIGQNESSLSWIEQALTLEPANILFNSELARAYYNVGRYADAQEQFDYTLELDATFLPAIEGRGWNYVAMEKLKKAHYEFEQYQKLVFQEQKNIPHLIYIAARLGMDDTANHFLEMLQLGEVDDTYIPTPVDIALVYLGMEKYDEVFFHLQRAADDKIGKLYFILSDPIWSDIRNDSRFDSLLRELEIPDAREIDFLETVE